MNELVAKLNEIDGKLDALLSHDELSAEQQAEHDRLVTERKNVIAAIGRQREKLARDEERNKIAADAAAAADLEARTPASNGRKSKADAPTSAAPLRERRDEQGRVVSYFEDTDETINLRFGESAESMRQLSHRETKRKNARFLQAAGYKTWGEFQSATDFIRSGLAGHTEASFRERHNKHFMAVSGMSEGVGSDGGYLVMPELASGIIDRVYSNDLFSRTDNYTVTGNSMTFVANAETSRATGSRHGGLRGYWLGEGATKTPSKPTFREINLKLAKLAVIVYLTDELLADTGTVLNDYVTRKAAEEFNFMLGDSLINGTGVGQPLGVLNAPSLISVAKEGGQGAATLQTENIVKMFSRFFAPNRSNMIWLHNQDVEPQLFLMTLGIGAAGVVTYMPPGGLSSAPYATLMGRPSMPSEFCATLGTQGDIIAADLKQMLSISKGGIAQAVSIHVAFLSDQTALRFVMRVNATPWESAPLTPYRGTATQSNFVVLDNR